MSSKPGKIRKAKRRARKQAESELVQQAGSHWETGSDKENAKLLSRAMRWRLNRKTNFEEQSKNVESMGTKDIAIMVARRLLLSMDPDVMLSAMTNIIKMEAQNQADDHIKAKLEVAKRMPEIAIQNTNLISLEKLLSGAEVPDVIEQQINEKLFKKGDGSSGNG